jgi:SAM-dependent methyltransferase
MRNWLRAALVRLRRSASLFGLGCLYAEAGATPLQVLREGIARGWTDFATDAWVVEGGWMPFEQAAAECIGRGERVVVVGCGTGRDMLPLIHRGCTVVGIEPAASAVNAARQVFPLASVRMIVGFIEDVALTESQDVFWFSWYVYSYMPVAERRIRTLARIRESLAPAGRVVLSYMQGTGGSRGVWLARLIARVTGNDWKLEPGDVPVPVDDTHIGFLHYFTPADIERQAEAAGFEVRHLPGEVAMAVLTVRATPAA